MSIETDTASPMLTNVKMVVQATGWTNNDFPEIGDDTPYQLILDQTASAGYKAGSTGHNTGHCPIGRR